ncbi:MAG: GPW/gp25 family protein [Cytophagales bacterium]|nr:GPW/gp25 family protein [Cytophagales bacterium]
MEDDVISGWKFPPSFNLYGGNVEIVRGNQSIQESLFTLLTTVPGERNMELDYGCDVNSLAFGVLDQNTKTFMTNNIKDSITKWEKRIRVDKVELSQENSDIGKIHIKISYTVLQNNNKGEFAYNYSAD